MVDFGFLVLFWWLTELLCFWNLNLSGLNAMYEWCFLSLNTLNVVVRRVEIIEVKCRIFVGLKICDDWGCSVAISCCKIYDIVRLFFTKNEDEFSGDEGLWFWYKELGFRRLNWCRKWLEEMALMLIEYWRWNCGWILRILLLDVF